MRPNPTDDAQRQQHEGQHQERLPDKVDPVPKLAMWHLVAVRVAERLRQGPARADPAAVRALAPEIDEHGDEYAGLDEADGQPAPKRLAGEDVPDHQRPRQNETVCAPVFSAMAVAHGWEELIGER